MASGPLTTRRVEPVRGGPGLGAGLLLALAACTAQAAGPGASSGTAGPPGSCAKPLYLTFDTGHMGVAPLIAEVLKRQQVRVTFFAANEPTQQGDGTLGEYWAHWWRERAAEGHTFASHTYDHVYWRADLPAPAGQWRFRVKPPAGPLALVPRAGWQDLAPVAGGSPPVRLCPRGLGAGGLSG